MIPLTNQFCRNNLVRLQLRIRHFRIDLCNLPNNLQPFNHAPEARVLPIQIGGWSEGNKELSPALIWAAMSHAK